MILEPLLLSLLFGWLRGGEMPRLSQVNLAYPEVAIIAVAVQKLLPMLNVAQMSDLRYWLLISSYLLILVILAVSKPSAGVALAALGIFLNLLVVSANGGMPVAMEAAASLGYRGQAGPGVFADGIHRALDPSSRLSFLADRIPYPAPSPFRAVLSVGDLVLAVGVFLLVQESMVYRGKHAKRV